MTTPAQNQWAQYLETATPREIRQMAEYAIDHIGNKTELMELEFYVKLSLSSSAIEDHP